MRFSLISSSLRLSNMAGQLKPKRPRLSQISDKSYFESYADITVHEEMLGDDVRTNSYKNAIFNLKDFIKNKIHLSSNLKGHDLVVVLDVGAGTGILSCFCAQAGAKKVYAVEASNIAEQAKKVVLSNGLSDQVEVIQGLLENVTLPEQVDVIVSEWMGYCLLYESMLTSVLTARDRWLKPGGLLLPDAASMYIAPICDDEIMVEKVNFWNDMDEVYGVDMACLLPFARKSLSKEVMVKNISCENILSQPQLICQLNLNEITHQDIQEVQHKFQFYSFGIADFQGFAIWFDVFFPCQEKLQHGKPWNQFFKHTSNNGTSNSHTSENHGNPVVNNHLLPPQNETKSSKSLPTAAVSNIQPLQDVNPAVKRVKFALSTSPYKQETHWKQSLLYLDEEIQVGQDSSISGTVSLTPCPDNPRFLSINLNCQVEDKPSVMKTYLMGYELPNNKEKSD